MVRLKGLAQIVLSCLIFLFQFQNGAIKSPIDSFSRFFFDVFQFQNGAIKSSLVVSVS